MYCDGSSEFGAGCPCTHPFYSELLLRKSKPYGLANLSFRFIGVGGANYLTTIVRNTKIFLFFCGMPAFVTLQLN
jgi:hypothetical protein